MSAANFANGADEAREPSLPARMANAQDRLAGIWAQLGSPPASGNSGGTLHVHPPAPPVPTVPGGRRRTPPRPAPTLARDWPTGFVHLNQKITCATMVTWMN
jgi:hypothetical protein